MSSPKGSGTEPKTSSAGRLVDEIGNAQLSRQGWPWCHSQPPAQSKRASGPCWSDSLISQHIIVVGLTLAATGFLLVATTGETGQYTAMVLLGLGAGIIMAIAANVLISSAP